MNLTERLAEVEARVLAACEAAGRARNEVELMAVSKTKAAEQVREVFEAGQILFGENRVQELLQKQPELPSSLRWHLIGHLQSNKVKHALHAELELIHSVDSQKLMLALNRAAEAAGRTQAILLQVNVSAEASKFGMTPDELPFILEQARSCMNLEIQGLMCIPPASVDPEDAAAHFAALRELRDQAAGQSGFDLSLLSMGMSKDLEVAIREGSHMVRIGRDIFGERPSP